jgi:thioesterase domain-containing protein
MLSDARRADLVARLRGLPRAAPAPPQPDLLTPLAGGGGAPPMILCHPVSGTIHGYAALAQAVAGNFRVYGIATPDSPTTVDLPRLAAAYADAVHKAHPGVPCVLGGWSIGGIVAFEVARQLAVRGQPVDKLVFIDSPRRPWLSPDVDPVLAFVTDAARSLGLPPPADTAHRLDALARRLAGPTGDVAAFRHDLHRRYEVFVANWRMVDGYRPADQLAADALIVCAQDSPNRPMEWADHVKGTVRTLHVTGDHYTCLRPPWVFEIAAALKEE